MARKTWCLLHGSTAQGSWVCHPGISTAVFLLSQKVNTSGSRAWRQASSTKPSFHNLPPLPPSRTSWTPWRTRFPGRAPPKTVAVRRSNPLLPPASHHCLSTPSLSLPHSLSPPLPPKLDANPLFQCPFSNPVALSFRLLAHGRAPAFSPTCLPTCVPRQASEYPCPTLASPCSIQPPFLCLRPAALRGSFKLGSP